MTHTELTIHTDGGARGNPGPAAVGVTAVTSSGETLFEISQYIGQETNNVAEYSAVIHSLKYLQEHGIEVEKITYILDSELIVRQLQGIYKVKEPRLIVLNQNVKNLIQKQKIIHRLKNIDFINVPRNRNKRADELVNQALDSQQ